MFILQWLDKDLRIKETLCWYKHTLDRVEKNYILKFSTQLIIIVHLKENTTSQRFVVNSLSWTELHDLSLPFYLYPENQIIRKQTHISTERKTITTKTEKQKKNTRKIYIQNNNSKIQK